MERQLTEKEEEEQERLELMWRVADMAKKLILKKENCSVAETVSKIMHTPVSTVEYFLNKGKPKVDKFGEGLVRNVIYGMYEKGERLTLRTLLEAVRRNKDIGFSGADITLRGVLQSSGFSWKKVNNCRSLVEKKHIIVQRSNFLTQFMILKQQGCRFVYMDETMFQSKRDNTNRENTSNSEQSSEGEREEYIMILAGDERGLIENVKNVLLSKPSEEASWTPEVFQRRVYARYSLWVNWVKDELLPKLNEPSVIIMDNSTIHNVEIQDRPLPSWNKAALKNFLSFHKIPFGRKWSHASLFDKASKVKCETRREVDDVIHAAGHKVLRTPTYHYHYIPMGMVWRDCKKYHECQAETQFAQLSDAEKCQEALQQVTAEKWKNYVRYTEKIIEEDWNQELKYDAKEEDMNIVIPDDYYYDIPCSDSDDGSDSDTDSDSDDGSGSDSDTDSYCDSEDGDMILVIPSTNIR